MGTERMTLPPDGAAVTVLPRLSLGGASLDNIFYLTGVRAADGERPINLSEDRDLIRQFTVEIQLDVLNVDALSDLMATAKRIDVGKPADPSFDPAPEREAVTALPPRAPDPTATAAYLETLFGTADDGYLAVWTLEDRRTAWFAVTALGAAAAAIAERSAAGVQRLRRHGAAGRADSARTGAAVPRPSSPSPAPGTTSTSPVPPTPAPACRRRAMAALRRARRVPAAALAARPQRPRPLPALALQGGLGLRGRGRTAPGRRRSSPASSRRSAPSPGRHGYDLETTGDLARVLRPVGVLNRKPGLPPAPVRLLAETGLPLHRRRASRTVLPDEDAIPLRSAQRTDGTGRTTGRSRPHPGRVRLPAPLPGRCRDPRRAGLARHDLDRRPLPRRRRATLHALSAPVSAPTTAARPTASSPTP